MADERIYKGQNTYDRPVNHTPGMDHEQQRRDAAGWSTGIEMVTGGVLCDAMHNGGMEVGNPRDLDPMSEEYNPLTYGDSIIPAPATGGGMGDGTRNVESTKQGGNMAMAPQVYSKYQKRGDY